ncbi:MAG: monofunctional biosynthetic peptidoglycan transglycosylase [Candidatus Longimicrobiales bacterium M2_2A_002]
MSEADPEPETVQSDQRESEPSSRRRWRRVAIVAALVPVAFYLLCIVGLVYARFLPPLTTGVQLQRTVERVVADESPVRDYRWRPIEDISPHFPRAVVAAEDARFYRHAGFDWKELRRAREEAERGDEAMRGASTLTHQLIKNLFFTTHRNPVRKLYEWGLTLPAEWILGKDRIVELYVNVVELGPGTFGAEAAARHYFGVSADRLTRHQAASLAAILPAPLRRRPAAMTRYTAIIEERMSRLGW